MEKNNSEYKSRLEWKKAKPKDYKLALSNGFMGEICEHFGWDIPKKIKRKHPNGYWTPEKVLEDALKYNTTQEWRANSSTAYSYAFKIDGLYIKCIAHMGVKLKRPRSYWTPEVIMEHSKKFKSPKEWKDGCSMSYSMSFKTDGLYVKCLIAMGITPRKRGGYWNIKENVLEEAKKYNTKGEWAKGPNGGGSSYESAKRNGWFDECTTHMKLINIPSSYWTLERCMTEAKKYNSRVEWHKNDNASYYGTQKNGWLDECTAHMDYVTPNGHWNNKENVLEEARKYKTRSEWSNNSSGSYTVASKKGWKNECCEHMNYADGHTPAGFWTKDKVLIEVLKYKTRSEWIKSSASSYHAAKRDGYIEECLKKVKTGGFVSWYKENCMEEAKKYTSRSEWQKGSSGSYKSTLRNGWMDECTTHMTKKQVWTKIMCIEEAKKYTSRTEWRNNSSISYNTTYRKKWLDECTTHMVFSVKPKGYWTKERCIEEAKKYTSRSEWSSNSSSSYNTASKKGWKDECTSHMELLVRPNYTWTRELLINEARKYTTKTEWCLLGEGYSRAKPLGCFDECTAHMIQKNKPLGFWKNKENCMEEAKKYTSRSEWQKGSSGSYKSALRYGWMDECTKHMK